MQPRDNKIASSEGVLTSTGLLGKFLNARSLVVFSGTSQAALRITYAARKNLTLKRLLKAAVRGNQDLAMEIVTCCPELLLDSSAVVTDLSGKEIKNLTPIQAAICASDTHMVHMMRTVLDRLLEACVKLSFSPGFEIRRQITTIYPNGDIDSVETAQMVAAHEFKTTKLIDIFAAINIATAEQVRFELDSPGQDNTDSQLNAALRNFREQFTATSNQELIFNPFYLLKASELYLEQFRNFNGNEDGQWAKRDLFWRQVIGYIQRHLPSCCLQAFARGIGWLTSCGNRLKRDFEFELDPGFYMRPDIGSSNNLGFSFASTWRAARCMGHVDSMELGSFEMYSKQKSQFWRIYLRAMPARNNSIPTFRTGL